MDYQYLTIILIVLAGAAALLFIWMRRDRADKPVDAAQLSDDQASFEVAAAEALVAPTAAITPEAVAAEVPTIAPTISPAEVAASAETAAPPDALTRIKGLGPKAAAQLGALGIIRYDQLAALSGADLARIDEQMGAFKGRIVRDRWVEQAGHLAAGDIAGFEAKFGKLGG